MTNRELLDAAETLFARLADQIAGYSHYGSCDPERLNEIRDWVNSTYVAYFMDTEDELFHQ